MISDEWLDLGDLIDRVSEFLELGLPDSAKETLDKYEPVFQTDWEFHFLYSRMLTDQNKPREAVPYLIRGLRLERGNVDCMIGMFYALSMMNRVMCAGKFLLAAEKIEPDNELVLSALIWYHTETNDAERAVECFERAQNLHTNNPDTYRNAGIAFDRLGRSEEAEACYKAALIISPSFEEARDLYADHLLFNGKTEDAIRLYEDALRESPKNIRHISKLIYCLSQAGDFNKAESLARHSITNYPNSPLGYIDLAYVYLNTGRLDEAAQYADLAIAITPIDAEGYRIKAIASSESGMYDDANNFFEHALSLDVENTDVMRDYYKHLYAAGEYDQMIELANEVIDMEHPYCTEDYWFLANFYRADGDDLKSFRYLRLAYDTAPTDKEPLRQMIEILLERGHTKFTLPLFAEYVRHCGWNAAMSALMTDKQFSGSHTQEGMRFLRFTGERPKEFRAYVFKNNARDLAVIYYTIVAAAFMLPAAILFGWLGAAATAAVYALTFVVAAIGGAIKNKFAERRAIAQSNAANGAYERGMD